MKNQKLKELFNSKKNDVKIMEYYNDPILHENTLKNYPLAVEFMKMKTTINYILGVDSPYFPCDNNYDVLEMGLEIIFNTNYETLIKEGLATQK